jgi:hypothetical protein
MLVSIWLRYHHALGVPEVQPRIGSVAAAWYDVL